MIGFGEGQDGVETFSVSWILALLLYLYVLGMVSCQCVGVKVLSVSPRRKDQERPKTS